MTSNDHRTVRLTLTSTPEMPDFVQVVGDHIARSIGLEGDALHWVGVALRECVVNAIKHGNRFDPTRQVFVEFVVRLAGSCPELSIRVRDQGEGFDPEDVADPLAPENLLKTSGRGIFLMRSFMDDVLVQRASEGGMEVVMVKRCPPAGAAGDPAQA
jgi:serine/threonine-protein kinase RsbW